MGLSLWSNLNARRSRPSPAQSGYAPLTWRRFRKGVASVLAMLYLIIFSTLAVGFYTAVTTSVQLAHNDERSMNALVIAPPPRPRLTRYLRPRPVASPSTARAYAT